MEGPICKTITPIANPDGSTDWWELSDQWRKVRTDPPTSTYITQDKLDEAFSAGLTKVIEIGQGANKVILSFKKGLLVKIKSTEIKEEIND